MGEGWTATLSDPHGNYLQLLSPMGQPGAATRLKVDRAGTESVQMVSYDMMIVWAGSLLW